HRRVGVKQGPGSGYNVLFALTSTQTERYRSGRNGGASKASCRVTGTWVRIPPSPPSSFARGRIQRELRRDGVADMVRSRRSLGEGGRSPPSPPPPPSHCPARAGGRERLAFALAGAR